MSSSKASDKSPSDIGALAEALGFDPDAVLVREPGVLFDPRFLGALHAELADQQGDDGASVTLLQIGFLHGLRDAVQLAGAASEAPSIRLAPASAAPLPIRLRSNPHARPKGAIEFHGCWPERQEAAARLSKLGATRSASCWVSAGYTSGWLSALFDADLLAVEEGCCSAGDETCRFVVREARTWRGRGDAAVEMLLDAVPFGALPELLAHHGDEAAPPAPDGVDPEQPVVHIWGPVMVVPFCGADDALEAVDLIRSDPGAAEVSVVVIDLSGSIIDEAFGASALEQIVESVETWGAEAIFTGVSSLSEPVVFGLERQPLMIHKDLQSGIAAAFQIAESQRRPL
jgi:hypothetical protein